MSSRARRMLNMAISENNNFIHSRKQEPDQGLPILKENKNSPIHLQKHDNDSSFTCDPTSTDFYDNSFDTNSIPDSQTGFDLDLSFDDSNEKDSAGPKRTNKVVENSSSDSDDDYSSSSDSDSTGSESTVDAFSSDDSVKDPDYQVNSPAESDSDNESTRPIETHVFSPKSRTSRVFSTHPPSSGNIDMEALSSDKQPCSMANHPTGNNIQLTNVDSQPPSVDTQPPSVIDPPASVDTQPPSVIDPPASVDTQPPSVIAPPASVDTEPSSVDAQSPCVDTDFQHRSRKRKVNPELWKKNQAKLLKNSGKAYTSLSKSKKVCVAKQIGPVCSHKCKLKCSTKFTDEERLSIFEAYWATADLHIQRQFVHEHMTKITPKYRYTRDGSNRQNVNNAYYLPHNEVPKLFILVFKHISCL